MGYNNVTLRIPESDKAIANGVATLDDFAQVPFSQLGNVPDEVIISATEPTETEAVWIDSSVIGDALALEALSNTTISSVADRDVLAYSSGEWVNDPNFVYSTDIKYIVQLTQAEYDTITPDPNTLYIVV